MGADIVARIARPAQMRRLSESYFKRSVLQSIVGAAIAGLAYMYGVGEPRKRRYAEFYRNYDAEKEFEEMRKKGVFSSC